MSNNLPTLLEFGKTIKYNPKTGEFTYLSSKGRKTPDLVVRSLDRHGYTRVSYKGKRYLAHRVAFLFQTGEWPEGDVDHINGVRSDNKWENLRIASRKQNLANQRKFRGKSRFKGVSPYPNGWVAQYGRKVGYIGCSPVEKEAALMYNYAVEKEVGVYGKFNKVFEDVVYG